MNIQELYQKGIEGEYSPRECAYKINNEIGGITSSCYEPKRFTVSNHQETFSLDTRNQKNAFIKRMQKIALYSYMIAQQNGSIRPGELHFGKKASTKHHKKGMRMMLNA